jgi:YegS/Rv2252/BmrU family lipid kinase
LSAYTFIVNPTAGRGAAARLLDPLRAELDRRGTDYELVTTSRPGHATAAARLSKSHVVVAVGGDGTLNEVANGLTGPQRTMGIIPAGSGNDFIKSVGIPPKFLPALDLLFNGKPRVVDLGTVFCGENPGNSPPRYFVNGVGIGFDAAVAARTREIKFLGGNALYMLAVFQTLGKYVPPNFTFSMNGSTKRSRNLLIAIGNGRCAGGGFYLTPDAEVDDGLLDICMVDAKSIPQILTLMPKVMRGKHHNVPGVSFLRGKGMTVTADEPFYVHADGEIVGANVNRVEVGVLPGHLSIIAGP